MKLLFFILGVVFTVIMQGLVFLFMYRKYNKELQEQLDYFYKHLPAKYEEAMKNQNKEKQDNEY